MTKTDQDREGRSNAVTVLEAQVDDINTQINSLWQYNDKVLEEGERKLLEFQLMQVKKALKWVNNRGMLQSGDVLLGRVCTKTRDMTFSNLPEVKG